jgi:hypothetical protein
MRFVLPLLLALPFTADAGVGLDSSYLVRGDVIVVGNALTDCPEGILSCGNNSGNMAPIDVDADDTTVNSSSQDLEIPLGATVVRATLYVVGTGVEVLDDPALDVPVLASTVKFGTPFAPYETLTTSDFQFDNVANGEDAYQGQFDVTTQVQAAGSGTYTVADAWNDPVRRNAGTVWFLVVAYDDGGSYKIVNQYDGIEIVYQRTAVYPVTSPTPSIVTLTGTAAFVTLDGQAATATDGLSFGGTPLSNAANPVNNFANGNVSIFGEVVIAIPSTSQQR